MAHGFAPFAVNKNIPPGSSDPAIKPRVAILHVDAGNASSLFDFFKNRSGGIESHFHIRKDGAIEQYRSIYFQADANLDANNFAVSIETQGFGEGEWTAEQLASIKRLLLWLNKEAGIPLRTVDRWDGSGIGYHTLFGAPSRWTPVAKSCPGPDRKRQFHSVLEPWFKTALQPPKPKASLRVATFNVWVGQRGFLLRRNLRRMAKAAGWPHVIALQEAHGLRRAPRGYIKVESGSVRPEADNNVLLLRAKDVKLFRKRPLAIRSKDWVGPKRQAKTHPPRVHIGATVEAEGRLWDILGVHRVTSSGGKNEEQRQTEAEQIEAWVKHRQAERPDRVIVALGDWNGTPRWLARSVGGVLAMDHIDGAVVVGARVRGVRKIARKHRFGSDNHDPVVIDIEEKR